MKVSLDGVTPSIGTDVEYFISKNGKIKLSREVIEQNKHAINTDIIKPDGIQLEIAGYPGGCRESVINTIISTRNQLKDQLNYRNGNTILNKVAITIPKKEFDEIPEEDKIMGCLPSLNAYTEKISECKPNHYRTRSAGGHIHLGLNTYIICRIETAEDKYVEKVTLGSMDLINKENLQNLNPDKEIPLSIINCPGYDLKVYTSHSYTLNKIHPREKYYNLKNAKDLMSFEKILKENGFKFKIMVDQNSTGYFYLKHKYDIIKLLDYTIGLLSVIFFYKDKNEKLRRDNYGKAGEFRIQPHGIEYRVLSNAYIEYNPIASLFFGIARNISEIIEYTYYRGTVEKFRDEIFKIADPEEVRRTINEIDHEKAKKIFTKVFNKIYNSIKSTTRNDNMFREEYLPIIFALEGDANKKMLNNIKIINDLDTIFNAINIKEIEYPKKIEYSNYIGKKSSLTIKTPNIIETNNVGINIEKLKADSYKKYSVYSMRFGWDHHYNARKNILNGLNNGSIKLLRGAKIW